MKRKVGFYGRETPFKYAQISDQEVIANGQELGGGLGSRYFFGAGFNPSSAGTFFNGDIRNNHPSILGSTAGSQFTSRIFLTQSAYSQIIPYVDYEVLTLVDECNTGTFNTTVWTRTGSTYGTTSGISIASGTQAGSIFTTATLPRTLRYINLALSLNSAATANVGELATLLISGAGGLTTILQSTNNNSQSTGETYDGNLRVVFNNPQSGVNLFSLALFGGNNSSAIARNHPFPATVYVDTSAQNNGSLYLGLAAATTVSAGTYAALGWLRWKDGAANYVSTGSIQVTNDAGATWNTVGNGSTYTFGSAGSRFGVRVNYGVTAGGSEIIQQNAWGFRVYN